MSFNAAMDQFDAILALRPEQLPRNYQSVFLPGDLILYRSPDWEAPSPAEVEKYLSRRKYKVPGWMLFCEYCNLDKILGSTILASLCVLFGSRLGSVVPGFLLVFILAIGTLLLIASYIQPQLLRGSRRHNHYHTTYYILKKLLPKLLPSALYNHIDGKLKDFLDFVDVYRTLHVVGEHIPNHCRYINPDLEFRPISSFDTRTLLGEGWLVLRLQRYPDLFKCPCLAWLNKLYHTYRDYQRSRAASWWAYGWWAYGDMRGELGGTLHSMSELEGREDAKSLVWLEVVPPLGAQPANRP